MQLALPHLLTVFQTNRTSLTPSVDSFFKTKRPNLVGLGVRVHPVEVLELVNLDLGRNLTRGVDPEPTTVVGIPSPALTETELFFNKMTDLTE